MISDYSCNFEDTMCGWIRSQTTNSFKWKRQSRDSRSNTISHFDHTLGSSKWFFLMNIIFKWNILIFVILVSVFVSEVKIKIYMCLPPPGRPTKILPTQKFLFRFLFVTLKKKILINSGNRFPGQILPLWWPEVFKIFRSSYLC